MLAIELFDRILSIVKRHAPLAFCRHSSDLSAALRGRGMARVFISYAREDLKRAKIVAGALERAGHNVWWDRQLVGGSEYSAEIDSELRAADVVVVLWSAVSVASPWVRDEAAIGRDSGKLIPVDVDGTGAPLGFGQFHTIALARNSKRGVAELMDAVAKKSAPEDPAQKLRPEGRKRFSMAAAAAAASVLLVIAALFGWLALSDKSPDRKELALAVMPFDDMSPARDQTALAEGVSEEIMTLVSGTPGLRVIGRTSAWMLRDRVGNLDELRSRLGATHLLEGSVRSGGDQLRIAVRLIDTATGSELWSEQYRRPIDDIFAVQEAIGSAIAERLRGTVAAAKQARASKAIRTDPEAYKLYLAARAVGRRRDLQSQFEAEQLLKRALQIDPDYAPAHAFLGITYYVQAFQMANSAEGPPSVKPTDGTAHAREAIRLAPRYGEGYVALGMALSRDKPDEALRKLKRGQELDPANFYAWNAAAVLLYRQCRLDDAIPIYLRAVEVEPLLFVSYANLVWAYNLMLRPRAAEDIIKRFSGVGGDPGKAEIMQMEHAYFTGDFSRSLELALRRQKAGDPNFNIPFYVSSVEHIFGNIEAGKAALPPLHRDVVEPYWRGDYQAAAATAINLGQSLFDVHNLPAVAAKAMVHAGRSDELLQAIEKKWGTLDKFQRDSGCRLQFGPTIVTALQQAGRNSEASKFLQKLEANMRYRMEHGEKAINEAQAALLALRGRNSEAIASLNAAFDAGWVNQGEPYYVSLSDPAFNSLRSDPRFQAIERRVEEKVAIERTEFNAIRMR